MEIFCGIDWAEAHHDIALVDETGALLGKRRISDDMTGFSDLVALLAEHTGGDVERIAAIDVAIEIDHGLLVAALLAAGHCVYAINPKAVDRYRDRHAVSGAKSDPGDALVLAQILRTDRDAHRMIPANTDDAGAIKVLARAHADAVRARLQEANRLRSLLREFFPAALQAFPDLSAKTALAVLGAAPTPATAAALSRANLTDLLHAAGRGTRPAEAGQLADTFAAEQLRQPATIEAAMGQAVLAIVRTLAAATASVRELEKALAGSFEHHPDAEILDSFPGLGLVLGARVLAEIGDDRSRFTDAASLRNYAGTSPITRASGKSRVVLARHIRNKRLADACFLWAFAALTKSDGVRALYDARRAAGDHHAAALRRVANKLLTQLHHCLNDRTLYDEHRAWPQAEPLAA